MCAVLQDIYGLAREPNFVGGRVTAVTYHQEKATFHEEVKIRLPSHVGPAHHLLVTINQIQCKPQGKKSKGDPVEVRGLMCLVCNAFCWTFPEEA